ncbi:MAG: Winged helix-turn-helix, partial [Thermoproteota archaeon]|nr:Winged helix-turn-helix [Thermoproteota archaeon]
MKINQKRSRLETVNVILILSVNGIKKTHIMYKANMSHGQLEKYLEMLVSKGLLG